jgi:glycosyltransferase involved in cell wall biosynthesis
MFEKRVRAKESKEQEIEPGAPGLEIEKVRLLKFLTVLGVGGTEKQVIELSRRIDSERYEMGFACLRRSGHLLAELLSRGVTVDEYPIQSFFKLNFLRQQWRFFRQIRRDRVQIVHSYNFYANVFCVPAAKLAGVPCVVASLRDIGVYMTPTQRKVHKFACRFADHIIVNAEAIKSWLTRQGYRESKISVIPNGVSIPASEDYQYGAQKIREEFGVGKDAPLVTMIARIDRKKGVEDLIDAAAEVIEVYPEARFLVVGGCFKSTDDGVAEDSEYQDQLLDRVVRLGLQGKLQFAGYRKNIHDVLRASSVSVLPSLSEGLSNTLLESMACGVPIVSTSVGGTPELIENGVHGSLVPPSDPVALAHALCRLIGDPELSKMLSSAAAKRVREDYSFEKMTKETESLYARLLQ